MKRIKLIAGACCLSVAMASVVAGVSLANRDNARAQAYEAITAEAVETFYEFGAELVIPSATIAYGEENVPATRSVIVYPSGAIYDGGTHVLKEEGEYTIVYYATVSGKNISAEITFEVGQTKTVENKVIPVVDETAPVLTVHAGFLGDMAHKVALGESVEIPKATATDESALGEIKAVVYYNYGTEKQSVIGLNGGVFTPTKIGPYAIVYSVSDLYGNVAEEVVQISCGEAADNVAAKLFAEDFAGEAGAYVTVPECTITGLYSDSSLVKAYAQFEGETEREEILNGQYFPRNVGTYQIVYELETPFKTYSTTSTLTTSAAGNSQIGKAYIPKYFIKGYSYTLDDVVGYLFNGKTPEERAATAYIKADGGEYVEIDHKDFKIEASSTVQFKFTCGESVVETETVKVVDVGVGGTLKPEKYFYEENAALTVTPTTSGIVYSVEDGEGDYKLDFVNVLSLSALNFEFNIPVQDEATGKKYNEMKAVEITVTDYYDRSNSVVALYENNGGTLTLSINGGSKTTLARAFSGIKHAFAYNSGFVDSSSGAQFAWNGSFTSDKVMLSVRLVGVGGDAGVCVTRVGKQGLNSRLSRDSIAPNLYVANMQNGIHKLNSVVTLEPMQATDVLTPYLEKNMKFSVIAPDESFVQSVDGVALNGKCDVTRAYQVKLESYGNYVVTYTYTDQNGNMDTVSYTINVPERIAPTVVLDGVSPYEIVEAALNTKVKLAEYAATDDTTESAKLRVYQYVYAPDYTKAEISNGYFNATREGDYTVAYCCYDEEGNYTVVTYTVRVTAKEAGNE